MNDFKFSTLEYSRPDFQKLAAFLDAMTEKMSKAASYEELKQYMDENEKMSNHMMTMVTIVHIRHTLNTRDEFYEKENEYINDTFPTIMPKFIAVNETIMNSPFKKDIEAEYGKQYFVQMELPEKVLL